MIRSKAISLAALLLFLGLTCTERDNRFDPQSPLYRSLPPLMQISFAFDTSQIIFARGDTLGVPLPFSLEIRAQASDPSRENSALQVQYSRFMGDSLAEYLATISELNIAVRDSGLHLLLFSTENEDGLRCAETLFVDARPGKQPRILFLRCSSDSLQVPDTHSVKIVTEITDSGFLADSIFYIISPVQIISKAVTRNNRQVIISDSLDWTFVSRTAGIRTVSARLKDRLGRWDTASVAIVFYAGDRGSPPVIKKITASPNPAQVGQLLDFQISATDSDGVIVRYVWSFSDGYSSAIKEPRHRFTTAGAYTVSVTVTDDSGATAHDSIRVIVGLPANRPPVITRITARPNTGSAPLLVSFSAAASDSDGRIERYSWEFGDGSESADRDPQTTHLYFRPGVFPVRLIVSDNLFAKDTAYDTVVVTHENHFVYGLYAKPDPAQIGEEVVFWILTDETGTSDTKYTWYFPGDTLTTNVNHVTYEFRNPGDFPVRVSAATEDNPKQEFAIIIRVYKSGN